MACFMNSAEERIQRIVFIVASCHTRIRSRATTKRVYRYIQAATLIIESHRLGHFAQKCLLLCFREITENISRWFDR